MAQLFGRSFSAHGTQAKFPFRQLKGAGLTYKVPFPLRLQAQPLEHTRPTITETVIYVTLWLNRQEEDRPRKCLLQGARHTVTWIKWVGQPFIFFWYKWPLHCPGSCHLYVLLPIPQSFAVYPTSHTEPQIHGMMALGWHCSEKDLSGVLPRAEYHRRKDAGSSFQHSHSARSYSSIQKIFGAIHIASAK